MNTDNKLQTLDGLIARLKELREIAGRDCEVVCGQSFNSERELLTITMVSLDSCPQKLSEHIAILVELKLFIEERKKALLEYQRKQFEKTSSTV